MSVLATDYSVVVSRAAVVRGYPGGAARFERDAAADRFCSDGLVMRVGFDEFEQAAAFVQRLSEKGLRAEAAGTAADCVIVHEHRGPLTPCLWLEFGRNRHGEPLCWHAAARRGRLTRPQRGEGLSAAATTPVRPYGLRRLRGAAGARCYSSSTHAFDSKQSPGSAG